MSRFRSRLAVLMALAVLPAVLALSGATSEVLIPAALLVVGLLVISSPFGEPGPLRTSRSNKPSAELTPMSLRGQLWPDGAGKKRRELARYSWSSPASIRGPSAFQIQPAGPPHVSPCRPVSHCSRSPWSAGTRRRASALSDTLRTRVIRGRAGFRGMDLGHEPDSCVAVATAVRAAVADRDPAIILYDGRLGHGVESEGLE